jgi:DNA-binding transcriptional LysR family regulator
MATFAKVVDLNGFSAAARALKVPKAAVSRAVAELEAELGLKLLTRTTRRLALTPAGEQLLPQCRLILQTVEAVETKAALLAERHMGPLRVRADATLGRLLLAPLVPRFMEQFPDIPLELALGDERSDSAEHELVIQSGRSTELGAEHSAQELGSPPTLLCATPSYLQKVGIPQAPAELERFDVLLPDAGPTGAALRLTQGQRREEVHLRPKLAVNDPALLHASVAAGLGIGLLPEFLCRQGLATRRLQQVLGDWQLPPQPPLCAVYPARLAEDHRVRALIDFLAAHMVSALAR